MKGELPESPWHTHFIDEGTATPAGAPNAGADYCNNFLKKALNGRLAQSAVGKPWKESRFFLNWAIWGYLSPDSDYRGDERLIEMAREWIDRLLVRVTTPPEDKKKRKKWNPKNLPDWRFEHYTIPMLELEARPALREKIGKQRVAKYRAVIIENIEDPSYTKPEGWNENLESAQNYVNIQSHVMAHYIHGWILTGEQKYLRMAMSIVKILNRDVTDSGMFPYRRELFGDEHLEGENMYYHNVNIAALYMVYWATKSPLALDTLKKSVPYYPLFMEPPYHCNSAFDLWFKNMWRTFWPQQIAMVAAATGDGENAAIAEAMARDNVMRDRHYLLLGAHAYQWMARRGVEPKPVRDQFIIRDPAMKGLRVRHGGWSAHFTAGSSTNSRATALQVREPEDGGKSRLDALRMARPFLEFWTPNAKGYKVKKYCTMSPRGAPAAIAELDRAAVAATRYRPTIQDWPQKNQPSAPCQATEVWLMTDRGAVGLIRSEMLEETGGVRAFNHQFRFMLASQSKGERTGERAWRCGDVRLKIWQSDFSRCRPEFGRRYALSKKKKDWQVSLTDRPAGMDGVPKAHRDTHTPTLIKVMQPSSLVERHTRKLEVGHTRTTLAEISPTGAGFESVKRVPHEKLIVLRARTPESRYLVLFNPGSEEATFSPEQNGPRPVQYGCSWEKASAAPDDQWTVPAGQCAVLSFEAY